MIDKLTSMLGMDSTPVVKNYLGVVRYAFPWVNLYVVEPVLNGSIAKDLRLVSGSASTSRSGAPVHAYCVSDTVLVAQDADTLESTGITDYIVCLAAVANENPDTEGKPIISDTKYTDILTNTFDKVRKICGSLYMRARKRFNVPTDFLSGDTTIGGGLNNNISIFKHLIRIQCGKQCYVEMDSLLGRLRIVTKQMEYISPLKYNQDLSGIGSLLEYHQTAISYKDGMRGVLAEDKELKSAFRRRDIAGDVTTGWETAVSVPDRSDNTQTDVYSSKVRYDGSAYMVSAKGFEIRKSLDILTPYQKLEQEGFSMVIKEVDEFPEIIGSYTNKQDDEITNISLNDTTKDQKEKDFPRVEVNPDTWGISDELRSDELQKAVDSIKNRKLYPIGDAHEYPLPDTISIVDPHTGQKYTYFKSTSGFRQDPDGSLVLYDGYGSEIRMTRGNIIISPAVDAILRPGRDLYGMTGRHTAFVSQKDVTLHSSTSDVYIKGDRNVSVLSGLREDGKFIVDSRGGDGVLIRSKSKASFVAPDVFVGSIQESVDKVSTKATTGSGTVTIGGGSNTLVTGSNVAVSGESVDIIGVADDGNKHVSWISIDPDRIVNISKSNHISGKTYIGQISGILTASIGNKRISAGNQESPHLYVQANIDACYGIMCQQLWADQVISVRMYAGNADRNSGIKSSVRSPSISQDNPAITQTGAIQALYGGPWSDAFNLSHGFKYPSSAELGMSTENYVIPGMLWQKYLTGDKVWNDEGIPDFNTTVKSYVYPGEVICNGSVTTGVGSKTKIVGGYKINGY